MHLSGSLSAHLIWRSLGLLSNLIITILIARLLGAAASGQFFYLISSFTFIILIASLGMEPSITYFLASEKMNPKYLLRLTAVWIPGIVLFLFLMSLFVHTDTIMPLQRKELGLTFITGQLMISFGTAFFYGQYQFEKPAKIVCLTNLIFILLLLYFSMYMHQYLNDESMLFLYAVLILIQGLLMMAGVVYTEKFRTAASHSNEIPLRTFFTYSLGIWMTNLLFFLVTRIDYWLLQYFNQNPDTIGNYIQATRIAQLFQLFPSILAAFIFPSVASQKDQFNASISVLCRIMLSLNLILIVLLMVSGYYLFPFLFGKSFDQMYPLFLLLIPGTVSLSLLTILSPYFSGTQKVYVNMWVSLIGLTGICAGNIFFIPRFGVMAAAGVSSFVYLLCFLITLRLFLQNTKISIADCMRFQSSDFNFIRTKIKIFTKL